MWSPQCPSLLALQQVYAAPGHKAGVLLWELHGHMINKHPQQISLLCLLTMSV